MHRSAEHRGMQQRFGHRGAEFVRETLGKIFMRREVNDIFRLDYITCD